jgi:hypothetical protein
MKMKKIIIIISLLMFNYNLFASEPLAAYKYEGKWHFIDNEGNEMFEPPAFDNIAGYRDGLFLMTKIIQNKRKWFYVNTQGEIAFETDADVARLFRDDRAIVSYFEDPDGVNRKYGIIDKKGEFVVKPEYLDAIDYNEGKTYIMNRQERGFIDKNGNYIFKLDSLVGYPYFEGLAPVSSKKYLFGYIDTTGKVVIEPQFDEAKEFSEGLAAVNIDGRIGFIDTTGEYVIRPTYAFAQKFQDGHCFVGRASDTYEPIWGVVNKSGLLTVNFMYETAAGFEFGIGVVSLEGEYFFIDPFGNKVIDKTYTYADEFKNGLAWASDKTEGRHGFINPAGELVIEIPECEAVIDLRINKRVYF